jgi:hypothetical protein
MNLFVDLLLLQKNQATFLVLFDVVVVVEVVRGPERVTQASTEVEDYQVASTQSRLYHTQLNCMIIINRYLIKYVVNVLFI